MSMKNDLLGLILEGGNAIKIASRINQENVDATVNAIYSKLLPKLKVDKKDTTLLGSTGKKRAGDSSGDIDLAIQISTMLEKTGKKTLNDLYDFIYKQAISLGKEVKDMRQMGLISIAWDIENADGNQEGEVVQLDIMLVDNLEYAGWAYYSPHYQESELKGLYRNEIIYAIARYMDYKVLEKAMDKEGMEHDAVWERNFFDLGKGLLRGMQSRKGKRGLVKNAKTLEKTLVSNNPQEVVTMLFGPKYKPNDILTFEQALEAILSPKFVYNKQLKKILKMTADGILKKGYPIPDSLERVL